MPKKTARTKAAATKKAPARRAPAAAKPKTSAQELQRLINQMVVERQHHIDSIAEIDQTFKEFGIASGSPARGGKRVKGKAKDADTAAGKAVKTPGKKKVAKKGGKKAAAPKAPKAAKAPKKAKPSRKGVKPGKFEITGDQLILDFLKSSGGASTEDIRKHWESNGRRGKAENNLTNLVKSGKIKRIKRTDGPGSRYELTA